MLIVLSTIRSLFELLVILWCHLLILYLIRVHKRVLGTTVRLLELAELIIGVFSFLDRWDLVIIGSFLCLFTFNVHLYRLLYLLWRRQRSLLLCSVIFDHFLFFERMLLNARNRNLWSIRGLRIDLITFKLLGQEEVVSVLFRCVFHHLLHIFGRFALIVIVFLFALLVVTALNLLIAATPNLLFVQNWCSISRKTFVIFLSFLCGSF